MKTYHQLIALAGRFAVGIATLVAVACVVVIVSNGGALAPRASDRVVDAVQLEPIVVTISFERFAAIHAGATRLFARKPNEV